MKDDWRETCRLIKIGALFGIGFWAAGIALVFGTALIDALFDMLIWWYW